MKNIKRLLFIFLTFTLISAGCDSDSIEEQCVCKIKGVKQISFDAGVSWDYAGMDGRTGMIFPCYYDGKITNTSIQENGVMYQTIWNCKD